MTCPTCSRRVTSLARKRDTLVAHSLIIKAGIDRLNGCWNVSRNYFPQADISLLIVTQRLHWRSCTHRDPPIQIAETKQRDGSGPGARGRLGGPRQCLRVDILTDLRHFAISNGNGEDPMVLECLIRGLDSPGSEADDQNPVSLRYELGGFWVRSFHRFVSLPK